MKQKLLFILALLCLMVTSAWADVVASGNCGTEGHESDVTYCLTSDGVLTISGTGAMADFGWNWEANRSPFIGNTTITSVVIEEGVTHLGDKAFVDCSNLATVSLPASLESIGEYVFFSCSNLESFTVATGNTHFASDGGLLYNSDKTTALVCPAKKDGDIVLPATVTTLSNDLFNGKTSITSLDMSTCTSLTTISSSLCYGCTALETVTLPASITVIDKMAFQNCSALTTINLSDCTALTKIGVQAFKDCSLLAGTFTLPNTVTCIGTSAFENCAKLEEIVIQSKLGTFVDDPGDPFDKNGFGKAFDGCTLLKLNVTDTDLAKAILSSGVTQHYWHQYAYMLKTMPFTVSGVTLSPIINDIQAMIDMTSSTTMEIAEDVIVGNVSITRTLVPDQACTVMLPFAITRQFIGGGTFYTFTGVEFDSDANKWKATMSEIAKTSPMAANTPYLLVPSSTAFESEITGSTGSVTLNTTTNSKQTVVGDWTFKGVYAEKTWAAADCGNDYGFAATSGKATDGVTDVAAGDFVKLAAGAYIKPMRSYLTYTGSDDPWAAGARSLDGNKSLPQSISVVLVGLNGETTEIGTITPTIAEGNEAWFSLDGIRLNGAPTKKGLYINNGKKVVIK